MRFSKSKTSSLHLVIDLMTFVQEFRQYLIAQFTDVIVGAIKNFNNVSRIRHNVPENTTFVKPRSSERQPCRNIGTLFAQNVNECMFCGKERKYARGSTTPELIVTCVTPIAEQAIKDAAQARNDYTLMGHISGEDLKARRHDIASYVVANTPEYFLENNSAACSLEMTNLPVQLFMQLMEMHLRLLVRMFRRIF